MSTLRLLNAQIGTSVTPSQNFTWYQPTVPDGSVRLGVGNSGATTKDMIKVSGSDIILDTPKAIATPPQFDNSKLLATTDWVKQNGLNFREMIQIAAAITLDNNHVGRWLYAGSTGNYVIKLPVSTTLNSGSLITLFINSPGIVLTCQGSDAFQLSSGQPTSINTKQGETYIITTGANGGWYILAGSGELNNNSILFGSSKTTNGYQRLPSGLILQWSQTSRASSGASGTYNSFPITFPNACLYCTGIHYGAEASVNIIMLQHDNTGVWFKTNYTASDVNSAFVAIGY